MSLTGVPERELGAAGGELDDPVAAGVGEPAQRGVDRLRRGAVDRRVGEPALLRPVEHVGVDLGRGDGHASALLIVGTRSRLARPARRCSGSAVSIPPRRPACSEAAAGCRPRPALTRSGAPQVATSAATAPRSAGAARNTLPGLNSPAGSSAALIARCTASATGPISRSSQSTLDRADAVLAGDRAAQRQAGSRMSPNAAKARARCVGVGRRRRRWSGACCRRRRARRRRSSARVGGDRARSRRSSAAIRDRGTPTSSISRCPAAPARQAIRRAASSSRPRPDRRWRAPSPRRPRAQTRSSTSISRPAAAPPASDWAISSAARVAVEVGAAAGRRRPRMQVRP